jgi:hypothetical protein
LLVCWKPQEKPNIRPQEVLVRERRAHDAQAYVVAASRTGNGV